MRVYFDRRWAETGRVLEDYYGRTRCGKPKPRFFRQKAAPVCYMQPLYVHITVPIVCASRG